MVSPIQLSVGLARLIRTPPGVYIWAIASLVACQGSRDFKHRPIESKTHSFRSGKVYTSAYFEAQILTFTK